MPEDRSRHFVEIESFTSMWRQLALTDMDLAELEILLMQSPTAGAVMRETGGLRKLRFSPSRLNIGKSGAYRVTYLNIDQQRLIILLVVFDKSEKDNLTKEQRNNLRKVTELLKTYYR